MSLINLPGRAVDAGTKKIFTAKNYKLLDRLIKDDANTKNTTESIVIEDILLDYYLNSSIPDFAYIVAQYLFQHANNDKREQMPTSEDIAATCKAICDWFSAMPEKVNDSVLPFLYFLHQIELRHRTEVTGKEEILPHFVSCLSQVLAQLEKYGEEYHNLYTFPTPDNRRARIDSSDLMIIKDLCEIQGHPENINVGTYFSSMIFIFKKLWYVGGDQGNASFRNWTYLWRVLADFCSLAKWPDYPAYRNELITIVRAFTLNPGKKGAFNQAAPVLNRQININGKILKTTEDAVILKSNKNTRNEEYTQAYRVINGIGAGITERPYILLFKDDEAADMKHITEKLVEKYARDEFFDPSAAIAVPILDEGIYYDERIKWLTV